MDIINEYLDAKYTEAEIDFSFKTWVNYLANLYYHNRAGRNLNTLGLSLYEWNVLSVITEHLNDQEFMQQQRFIWGKK